MKEKIGKNASQVLQTEGGEMRARERDRDSERVRVVLSHPTN